MLPFPWYSTCNPSSTSTRLSFTSTDDTLCSVFLLKPLICIRRTGLKPNGISINRRGEKKKSFVNNISSNPGLSDELKVPHSTNLLCRIRYQKFFSCYSNLVPLCASFIFPGIICLHRCASLRSEQPKAVFLYN